MEGRSKRKGKAEGRKSKMTHGVHSPSWVFVCLRPFAQHVEE